MEYKTIYINEAIKFINIAKKKLNQKEPNLKTIKRFLNNAIIKLKEANLIY